MNRTLRTSVVTAGAVLGCLSLIATTAAAQTASAPQGAPPPEAKALVEAPKSSATAPTVEHPNNVTSATLSAGGMSTTGNSRMVAGTANGSLEIRRGDHGFGASVLGNYGRAGPAGQTVKTNSENVQGRARYDYFMVDRASAFLIGTGRYDRFQGLDFRLNIDPGFKYLLINQTDSALWGEVGYDFQYDIRLNSARQIKNADGTLKVDTLGNPDLLEKTKSDHSSRLFAGFRHAFNDKVTFSTGIEYLQSFVDSKQYRVNYDAVFAANISGGLALGLGFTARYDHNPLPDKARLDTATTVSLIYAFSSAKPAAAPDPEPPAPAAAPTPAAPPAPAATPVPAALPAPSAAPVPSATPAPAVAPAPAPAIAPAPPAAAAPAPGAGAAPAQDTAPTVGVPVTGELR